MAVTANSIITPQGVRTAYAVADTASTDIDDAPTTTVSLLTAGSNGSRVVKLTAIPRATVTASRLDLWLSKDGGTTKRLIDTALMSAHTVANTTKIPTTDFGYSEESPLILGASDVLYVSTSVALAGGIVFYAAAQDY